MLTYNRAQNIYASAVAEQANKAAIEAGVKAGLTPQCEVKIVPTDIFGNILVDALVSVAGAEAKSVAEFGNIAYVDKYADVAYSVELAGFESVEGSIPAIKNSQLVHVTLQFASEEQVEAPVEDPEEQPADSPEDSGSEETQEEQTAE